MNSIWFTLAQTDPVAAVPATKPWWQLLLENGLPLTLLFIFLVAIISVIVKVRRKDKCLKLLNNYHVSYLTTAGRATWGDLVVYSQGLELQFDEAYHTRAGLIKSSVMVYETEMGNCLAVCRVEDGLTPREVRKRQRQIRRSFRPGLFRRTLRWLRNIVNTLRDAFSKALTAIVGQLAKVRPESTVLAQQQGSVNEIGQTLLGAAANAYEPILEAHIGKPVILKLASPTEPTNQPLELPGYLVDYTDKYIAVFNVSHEPLHRLELSVTESIEQANLKIDVTPTEVIIRSTGPDVVVVKTCQTDSTTRELAVPLTPGCVLELARDDAGPVKLVLDITRQIDMVCPRSIASVHFGADITTGDRRKWLGLAPFRAAESQRGVGEI